jgi:hypothetical protein
MPDVAKSMYQGRPGTSDTLLYTAPAGGAIVRNIHVANETASAATVTLSLNAGASLAAGKHFLSAVSIPANSAYDWSGFKVLDAAGTIRALQGTNNALTVSIDGVELT